jgi:hypothetical protein
MLELKRNEHTASPDVSWTTNNTISMTRRKAIPVDRDIDELCQIIENCPQ